VVNLKRVYRLYRDERLLVRPHRGRKHAAVPRVPLPAPTAVNQRWGWTSSTTLAPTAGAFAASRWSMSSPASVP
jgi:hypothetical protein